MKLGKRNIGQEYEPLVIAEIGINHGGDINLAKHMTKLAANAGAECIKHQTHFIEDEMTESAKEIIPPNSDISIWEIMEKCSLSQDEEISLKKYAESLGMIYISTPFSRMAADFLNDIGVVGFKIGSGECDNLPLISHIAGFNKPVIMSTGMQTVKSIVPSVEILRGHNLSFALLECTNLYPSPPEIVSLGGITELKQNFPDAIIGFSDHSIGSEMALASVALGACILERHFTDSRYRKGPDISCSMDPLQLHSLILHSKEIHKALLNKKERTEAEEDVYKFARGSLVADRELKAGKVIEHHDIWARRPGDGEIAAFEFDKVIGRRLNRELQKNDQLKWDYFDK